MDQFSLHLLGEFAGYAGDRRLELPPACQRVVALVALRRRPVHRLWVCATLWPHAQTRRAVASLRSALWRLRPVGAESLLRVDPQYLQLDPGVAVDWYDALDQITELVAGDVTPQRVGELLPLLRAGELLEKWPDPWAVRERKTYNTLRMAAFEALGHGADKPHRSCGTIRSPHAYRAAVQRNGDSGETSQ